MKKLGLIGQPDLHLVLQKNPDYEIVFSCDGENAIENLENNEVDVVLTELLMSGIDGFSLMESFPETTFIVATELRSEVFFLKAIEAGATYYIVKPVDYRLLKQKIDQSVALNTKAKMRDVSEMSLDERLSNIFISVGIPAHIRGFKFLREGVKEAVEDPELVNNITKDLYPSIALKYRTTSSKVERAIRHAIEVAWSRGRIDNLNALFGMKVYTSQDRPTNGEFIALLADKMIIETSDKSKIKNGA